MGKASSRIYQLCEWILRLAYLNLLWILFSIAGLIIFGVFPATTAAFTVARRWVNGESDMPLFRTFVDSYKKEFWKSQVLGLFLLVIGSALYMYVGILDAQPSIIFTVLKYLIIVVFFVYVIVLVYIFPVFVHYKLTIYEYIKSTIFLALLNPITTIVSLIGVIMMTFILLKFQGLMLFFSISGPVLWITFITQRTFKKIEAKRQMMTVQ
ncbi:YesL family protein [Sutcliffiella halmapala]|uniref:YesL family protein n=1 Tax=Sutcliffiella halmapala TaxID=79882 RepID=UPI00099521FF|nr:YesL family protein [Sutcliffiella halmapala]